MRAILPAVVVVMVLAPGCRCSSSSPAEPVSTAPSARPAASTDECPPQPAWGLPTPDGLVAELLMQPDVEAAKGTGTGIRIYDDGRVFAHDSVTYDMKDDKLTPRAIEPRWRQHRTLGALRLDELRTAIASVDADDLTGWHGANRDKQKGRPNFLTVQRDGKQLRSCFRGVAGGDGQKRVDGSLKKLMGEAFDASANRP